MPEPVTIREEPTTAVDPNATEEQQIAQEDNVAVSYTHLRAHET